MEMEPLDDLTADDLDGRDFEHYNADGTVLTVWIRRTDDAAHPSGGRYRLHYGLQAAADAPLLRYDNSHEREKGHERHTMDDVEIIEFPGMVDLYKRFVREYNDLRGV